MDELVKQVYFGVKDEELSTEIKREKTTVRPEFTGAYRANSIKMPEEIYKASGIVINGRRIKSVIFSTDIAIIRNCNADAVLAVYPFTPQQVISHTLISSASMPVLCGVGGGVTGGIRSTLIAKDAEAQGAFGVVVNAPFALQTISIIKKVIDIPIVSTVVKEGADIEALLNAGTSILNVSAAGKTAAIVREIRERYPNVPIIATGGPTSLSIKETVMAGANTISYTPASTGELFKEIMKKYRAESEEK